ncbi:MAG: hypothetical protein WDO15_11710 [Bacteroidota bacterium]
MYLTKEDLDAIGSLIDEKLIPIRTDIDYMKRDIQHLKKDVSELKFDVKALRDDITEIKIDVADLKRWRSEVEKHIN